MAVLLAPVVALSGVRFWTSGTCPYAQRVWCALEETGVEYDLKMVDLQAKSKEFTAAYDEAVPGGRAKVPVLQVGDLTLTESLPVTEFVAESFGDHKLLPETPERRALARLCIEVQPFTKYLDILKKRHDPGDLADAVSDFGRSLVNFEKFLAKHQLNDGPFLEGSTFTFCDAAIAPFATRANVCLNHFVDLNITEICLFRNAPRVSAYLTALLTRPSVVKTGVDDEKLIDATRAILLRIDAATEEAAKALVERLKKEGKF